MKFRVLEGVFYAPHAEERVTETITDGTGVPKRVQVPAEQCHKKGDVVESDLELDRMFLNKFRRVVDDDRDGRIAELEAQIEALKSGAVAGAAPRAPVPEAKDAARNTLESMSAEELQKAAAEEEVDLSGCVTKEEMIAKMLGE